MSVVKLRSYLSVTYFICFIVDLCVYLSQLVMLNLSYQWIGLFIGWLVGQWVGLSIGWSVNGLVCLLVVGQWVGLSIGWLVNGLICLLVGQRSMGNGLSIGQLVNGLVR